MLKNIIFAFLTGFWLLVDTIKIKKNQSFFLKVAVGSKQKHKRKNKFQEKIKQKRIETINQLAAS